MLIIIAVILCATLSYYFKLKFDCKQKEIELASKKEDSLKEMILTLKEDERAEFISNHMQKYYREKAFYAHIEKIHDAMNECSREEFILDYARTGVNTSDVVVEAD